MRREEQYVYHLILPADHSKIKHYLSLFGLFLCIKTTAKPGR
jgi:hypothetical protein